MVGLRKEVVSEYQLIHFYVLVIHLLMVVVLRVKVSNPRREIVFQLVLIFTILLACIFPIPSLWQSRSECGCSGNQEIHEPVFSSTA